MPRHRAASNAGICAERLNLLFERARTRGEPLTNEDVERLTGGVISANHVWRLRNGRNQNPGLETLQALADVFGVGLDYFAGRDDASDDVAIRRALAQPEVRKVVVQLGQGTLTPHDAARLASIVEIFLRDPSPPLYRGATITTFGGQPSRQSQESHASDQA